MMKLILMVLLPMMAGAAEPCASLAQLKLPDTTITMAEAAVAGGVGQPSTLLGRAVSPGSFFSAPSQAALAGLPASCRVKAVIRPTADSEIKIEVWMPAAGWNGKFMGIGNGGWARPSSTFALGVPPSQEHPPSPPSPRRP